MEKTEEALPQTEAEAKELLKRAHREQFLINERLRRLKNRIDQFETAKTGVVKVRQARKKDPRLPIAVIEKLTGFSRPKITRLITKGILPDRHPYSVGKLIRQVGTGIQGVQQSVIDDYESWRQQWADVLEMARRKGKNRRHKRSPKTQALDKSNESVTE